MKKITLKSVVLSVLLTGFTSFGQGTETNIDSTNFPIGIQNNYGVQDTRGSDLPSVLILGAPGNPDWILDVELQLDGTGLVAADTFLTNTGTPTLAEVQSYDSVLVFTDANAQDPVAFGDILGQYIEAGGAVVDATFTPNVAITGGFTAYELFGAAGQSTGNNLSLGTINQPNHPIMNSVTSFDGGTASFHNTNGMIPAGASVVAEYTDAEPLIIVQENVGPANAKRVFLNFYPPSIDARDDFWDTASDGALIMANALLWTSNNLSNGINVLIAASPGNPDWILDVEQKLESTGDISADTFLTNQGTPTLAELQQYDAVYTFTDANPQDAVAFGDALAQYIEAGGAVVDATFTPNVSITGGFTAYELFGAAGQSTGNNLGLGTIFEPNDPILTNVSTFDGGTASFHNTNGTIPADATVIAEYTDGSPFVIRQGNVGPANSRRVFLNFYPPSIDARDDFWDTASDGAQVMINALLWATNTTNNDGPTILIAASPGDPDWILDVEQKIEETNFFNADVFLTNQGTPTLAELQQYDAVYTFTDAGPQDSVAFGDVLAQYIDAGGAVVDATFTANVPIVGGFTAYELYSGAGQSNGTNLSIGTILEPNDPILTNVATFDGGTSSFHNTGGTIVSGATVIAEYTDGSPLIIRQGNVGPSNARRVFLNFYPPSIDIRDDFWDSSSDGAQIMRNALLWAIDGTVLTTDENEFTSGISIFPNPAQNELNISNTSGISVERTMIIDMLGRVITTIEASDAVDRTIDVSNLTTGIYFLRLESTDTSSVIKFIKK